MSPAPASSPDRAVTAHDPRVSELDEGEILRRILSRLGEASGALVGPGDDAAVIAAPDGRVVVTTDTLVQGPDFRLAWSAPFDIGWKAAAVNLADVAAMGARPTGLVVALAVPPALPVSLVEGIAEGLRAACDAMAPGCSVVGGDLTASDTLTVAVTAFGSLDGIAPVLRSGARPGDTLAVCGGALGTAARGLAVLFERGVDASGHPIPLDASLLSAADAEALAVQLRPTPPLAAGIEAARAGATAMMDISDGLALDASRIAAMSGVSVDIFSATLGPNSAWALGGGEDHGLLATFPAAVPLPDGFRAIGRVLPAGGEAVRIDGRAWDGRPGWDPYRDWDERLG
ncbi:MAG: thiamine-phosphate kinase [Microbacteriaceae bacterium]|jgi:thiamine-monophosphate kinase|nr:thiamine-phosphate kinase [Microbacteriaceae bacterium]HOA87399.1 thiamine-phosphate kinase [Microbacteriaceae bacterium]HPZ34042.1 thiamine-phosphate kinase [Microbacteriaceae bacterium]HQC93673.1 thiamine-phosphate kinase [Microbacteriaceae bacterium]